MDPPGDLAVIIPARDESDLVGQTVAAAATLAGADLLVVVDDGSRDSTSAVAAAAGARVVRHQRNRGKAAAMETGAEAVRLAEALLQSSSAEPHHLLFLDADLGSSAARAGPLVEPIRAGRADMTIARFADRVRHGGFGLVTSLSGAGIRRLTGWHPVQPLNGQRCLTRAAFQSALPLAPGFGAETGLSIDLLRLGMRVVEVEVALAHRATGNNLSAQLHRGRQFIDVARALATRR